MTECVLITGGAGFIGCSLAGKLRDFGLPIVAMDNLHPQVHPKRRRPDLLPEWVELREADVRDTDAWRRILSERRPRIIVHLAAETGTGQSLSEASRHADVNVLGTTVMLDALSRAGQMPEHFLLASSRAVYGEGDWRDEDGRIVNPGVRTSEALARGQWDPVDASGRPLTPLPHNACETRPAPTSVYGATKLCQEHVLEAWTAAKGASLSVLRFQNVYGPGQSPTNAYTGIINIFYRLARQGGVIDVYEDGKIGRDFVFIDDVTRACMAALERPPKVRRTLDVGTGVATTVHEAAMAAARLAGAPDPKVSGRFRAGDVRWAVSDASGLAADLGVSAETSFQEGLLKARDWLDAQE